MADDSSQHTETLLNVLRTAGYAVRPTFVQDAEEFREAVRERPFDLVLAYPQLGELDVGTMCSVLSGANRDAPLIVVADGDLPLPRGQLMATGAMDVVRLTDGQHLELVVERQLRHLALHRNVHWLEERADEAERRCLSLLDSSRDAIAYVHEGMHVYANSSYLTLFGYEEGNVEEIEGLPLLDLVAGPHASELRDAMRALANPTIPGKRTGGLGPGSRALGEVIGVRSDGARLSVSIALSNANYDGEPCLLVTARDLSERKQFERQLRHMRRRDPATGLFNEHYMREQLERIGRAAQSGVDSALVLVELDNFETIRRTIGIGLTHDIVRDVASVVASQLGERDLFARMNAQTFGVALVRRDLSVAKALAEQLRQAVEAHIWENAEHSIATTCSVGLALTTAISFDPAEVIANADGALQSATRRGGNQVVLHADRVESGGVSDGTDSTDLSADTIERAISDGQASILYQPIVHLAGATDEIYEVSISITDTTGAEIPADVVAATLVNSPRSASIDCWILKQALSTVKGLHEQGRTLRLFFLPAISTLQDASAVTALCRAVISAGLPAGTVTFEVPMEAVRQHVRSAKIAAGGFHKAECKVALRGFGTEPSDKTLLTHVKCDYLMLAPQALDDLASNTQTQANLAGIQERAQHAGQLTIATAVKDPHALTVLWQCGVPYAQGHYIQEPSRELSYDFSDD
jgi:diguanylate cyclase (GGDEF)-like protein/PAS domain S-box-containing protein